MYGKMLKQERVSRGISQVKLAELINVTQAQISFYESDKNIPSLDIAEKIADVYGISIDELIGRNITRF